MRVWLNVKTIKFYLKILATDFYWQPSYLLGERASLLSLLAARRRRRRGKRAFDFIDWLHEWRHNNRQNDTQRVSPKIIQLWRRHDTQHNGLFAALCTNKTQYNNRLSTTVSSAILLSVFMLNAILVCIFHAECHYFERRCAEGRGAAGNALYVS